VKRVEVHDPRDRPPQVKYGHQHTVIGMTPNYAKFIGKSILQNFFEKGSIFKIKSVNVKIFHLSILLNFIISPNQEGHFSALSFLSVPMNQ
jgi:hypothetical protein